MGAGVVDSSEDGGVCSVEVGGAGTVVSDAASVPVPVVVASASAPVGASPGAKQSWQVRTKSSVPRCRRCIERDRLLGPPVGAPGAGVSMSGIGSPSVSSSQRRRAAE